MFPIGLQALRELSHDVTKYAADNESEQWKCHGCETSKPTGQMSRCGECKVYSYCSKVCGCSIFVLTDPGPETVSMNHTDFGN